MKTKLLNFIVSAFLLLNFTGCGDGEAPEAEVIHEFETTFSVDSTAPSSTSGQGGYSSPPPTTSDVTRAPRPSGSTTPSSSERTGTSDSTAGSSSTRSDAIEVPPQVQRIAGNVVTSLNAGNYASAVHDLDLLMNEPGLTISQRRAARNTMAAVQRKLAMDPNISEEQKQSVREALAR